jgi:hypothetical protein
MTNPTRSCRHMALEALDFAENHAGGQARSGLRINLANILISRDIFNENLMPTKFILRNNQFKVQ